ncbi:hypothetical protein [Rubinisphaera sp.]|uniref:hypothetical protein n=1 Tax=Rubinisphaera sp. TaxID=2024857 RepID=UPI000C0F525B|nr:hypothetical protein [Rubinisphaera sp.]MBV10051.1 hypothetical protein [Rubinisphaera sp.]HCS52739.1 hypothetical protein [Planctomycetaceae bacterium]|tara:strand:+ start:274 stop:582 length:309 start_codon:yes stop_codon:yes gene_type:complete
MSNPFASDEYGRPPRHTVPPDSTQHGGYSSNKMNVVNPPSKSMDKLVFGMISFGLVIIVFLVMFTLLRSISPNAPTRLTPEGTILDENESESTDDEPAIRGD